ncbi:alpha/beta fold hydrolase [Thalassotalea ganghwensis]
MKIKPLLLSLACLGTLALHNAALALDREVRLGFQPVPLAAEQLKTLQLEGQRLSVGHVLPGGSFASAGLITGDIVLSINEQAIFGREDLGKAKALLRAGETFSAQVLRDGKILKVEGIAQAMQTERFKGADVELDAVPFDNGYLRAILVKPKNVNNPPVVYYIQGYTCGTVEMQSPKHPVYDFVQGLIDQGIAVWRVEKHGIGDSNNEKHCRDVGFQQEVDGFSAGFKQLASRTDIDASNIFLFGHSMGGYQAPAMVADGIKPAGVAIFGTGLLRWRDYMRNIVRYQSTLMGTGDPVESEQTLLTADEAITMLFKPGASFAEVNKAYPQGLQAFGELFGWRGDEYILGRSLKFMQDVDAYPITKAWSKVDVPVLALAGEVDMAIIDPFDTEYIARIVDTYHPGLARFEEVAGTNHYMAYVGGHEQMRKLRQSGEYEKVQYDTNPKLTEITANWVKEITNSKVETQTKS